MSNSTPRVFLGQGKEHEGKFGTYLTFRFGMATMFIERGKQDGTWNFYLKEAPPKQEQRQPAFEDRLADDAIPF